MGTSARHLQRQWQSSGKEILAAAVLPGKPAVRNRWPHLRQIGLISMKHRTSSWRGRKGGWVAAGQGVSIGGEAWQEPHSSDAGHLPSQSGNRNTSPEALQATNRCHPKRSARETAVWGAFSLRCTFFSEWLSSLELPLYFVRYK